MTISINDTQQQSDLTQLKKRVAELESREKSLLRENKYLRELYNRSPLGYQSLDAFGCLIEINQAWLEILGYEKQEVLGKNFGDLLAGKWRDQFKENFPKLKAVGEILGFEFEMRKKDGSHLAVRLDGRVGKNDQGGFQQTYCIIQDITYQRKAEKEREKLQAQLVHAQKMESIGRLASGIAHDFNNILSSVVGYAEIILDDELPDDSPARESLQEILAAGLRAKELVKQILAVNRHSQLKKRPMSLGPVVEEAINLLQASLPSNIKIRKHFFTENTRIYGDPTQIHQVVTNLGVNAGHAMRDTGGTLDVVITSVEFGPEDQERPFELKHGPYVEITVTDTGLGINPLILDKIFDPFFSTKPKEEGSGLGLSMVHGIVKNHNGAIIVDSEINKGTTFKVCFPQLTDFGDGEEVIAGPASQMPGGDERVLVVDDEPVVGAVTKKRLEKLGYTVTLITNSRDALDILVQDPYYFQLVIADQTMPELRADQLARRILSIRPDTPIILCTGYSHLINREQAKELGISDFLSKPFTQMDLARTIRKVLA
ncbi:ATP-binding protein [Desulfopila sp. IMCC35008]|uniref:ATP-binding protein n=1 Tax=Desulfopila sp. IMCC35008 TaxID=2653858 RepID=UPI0013D5F23B|nr:ATP-binding protein [Desulfopila sp. IMCC35008]